MALSPTSPELTALPVTAMPRMRPRNCFLYFVRFGCSIPIPPFSVWMIRRDFSG
jgi:hypothetical protein